MKEIVAYSDFNLDWIAHPFTGDVPAKINIDAIRQSVKIIFQLNPFDVPFNPNCYSQIKRYLFEPITAMTASNLQKRLEWMLETFEKRIKVQSIIVTPVDTENGFNITITYRVRALNIDDTVSQFFERIR